MTAVLSAQGKEPDGIDPATYAVRSASIVLPEAVSFYEAAATYRQSGLRARLGVTTATLDSDQLAVPEVTKL
jgi:hypothetical protein